MATAIKFGRTDPLIEPDLKEFIDTCLVPVLVRDTLKQIQAAEQREDLECPTLPQVRCANGESR
jgi:hypothetical protein